MSLPSDDLLELDLYRDNRMFRMIVDTYRDADRARALTWEEQSLYMGYVLALLADSERRAQALR